MPQVRRKKKKSRRTRIRRRKKTCYFTANKVEPDYKDVDTLRRFVNERGKIVPRRLSGVKAPKQRKLALAIKRARFLGLLPFVAENIR
jgi:small subunit ribosomal protein S18